MKSAAPPGGHKKMSLTRARRQTRVTKKSFKDSLSRIAVLFNRSGEEVARMQKPLTPNGNILIAIGRVVRGQVQMHEVKLTR